MRSRCCLVIWTLLITTIPTLRAGPNIYSDPSLPSRKALDRVGLKQAWYTVVPVDGRRDGLQSLQLAGTDLLVQTRNGVVTRLDSEKGRTYWRTQVGTPYQTNMPIAFNSASVFTVNGNDLYALDRTTGDIRWNFALPGGLSSPPVADDKYLFVGLATTQLLAYALPSVQAALRFDPTYTDPTESIDPTLRDYSTSESYDPTEISPTRSGAREQVRPRPSLLWSVRTNTRLAYLPAVNASSYLYVSPEGEMQSHPKPTSGLSGRRSVTKNEIGDLVYNDPGSYGDTAYIGSNDSNLYAININTAQVDWRYTAGRPIMQQPIALEKDVYVVSKDHGLARIDRATGTPVWKIPSGGRILEANPEAVQFISANPKFVYALGRLGRLLVIDRQRGTTLSALDVRGFNIVVHNQFTDRLYLAANNGLIVCLHDRSYENPVTHRDLSTPQQALEKKLEAIVSIPIEDTRPFEEMIQLIGKRFGLKLVISTRAYKVQDAEDSLTVDVRLAEEGGAPLRQILNKILAQANSTSVTIDDTILIIPKAPEQAQPQP